MELDLDLPPKTLFCRHDDDFSGSGAVIQCDPIRLRGGLISVKDTLYDIYSVGQYWDYISIMYLR